MQATIEISAEQTSTSSKRMKLGQRRYISGASRCALSDTYDITGFRENIFETIVIGFRRPFSNSYLTMLVSENVLRKDWDTPEEDEAWADL